MVKILESNAVEAVENSKSEPKVGDKPQLEPGPKIVAELMSPQEDIFFRPIEVKEFTVETLVNLPAEPTLELVSPLTAMKVSFFLRSSDVYDPLQSFLHETVS